MAVKAGTVADFASSMAAAMENAMAQEYQNLKGEPLPSVGAEDRRMLFVAVAQGVVKHLKERAEAMEVIVNVNDGIGGTLSGTGTVDNIETGGTLY